MMCLGILLTLLMMTAGGCKVEEKDDAKVSDMKFTVKKIIEEKKQKEMKLTYMSGDKLYIVRGYGVQKTGGYSIQVKDLYQAKNAVYFKSELIGPGENDVSEKVESYPYIVVSTEKTEDVVVFE